MLCEETMHRLRDQRSPGVPLHAQEQELGQVPRLEAGRLDAVRVLHHGDDRDEHHHTHDEGAAQSLTSTLHQQHSRRRQTSPPVCCSQ